MKKIKIVTVIIFFVLLLVPIVTFNWEENVVSEIDNRELTNNPFGDNYKSDGEKDLSEALEDYVQDRIGLRNEMISAYTGLYDAFFGEMVHPSYSYGKDGYVFGGISHTEYGDYQIAFADMVKEIQDYCSERNVPFVFMFDPYKATVLQDKLPEGVNYDTEWVEKFMAALDERGVNYVNNANLLIEKTKAGEEVFNKKYNPGHWNDLGAFYGVNNVLESLQQFYPELHINSEDEYIISERLNDTLDLSSIPIHEYEPDFIPKNEVEDRSEEYRNDLQIDSQHRAFSYIVNEEQLEKGAPKVLVFQGSYINGMGYKFFQNSFGEYIAVHNYENVMNFDYYFNIFQPECVVFEVAEQTLIPSYFNYEAILNMELNPSLDKFERLQETVRSIEDCDIIYEENEELDNITVRNLPKDTKYAYIVAQNGMVYDLKVDQNSTEDISFCVTVDDSMTDLSNMDIVSVNESCDSKVIFR